MKAVVHVAPKVEASNPSKWKVILFSHTKAMTTPTPLHFDYEKEVWTAYWKNPGKVEGAGSLRGANSGVVFSSTEAHKFTLDCEVDFRDNSTLTLVLHAFKPIKKPQPDPWAKPPMMTGSGWDAPVTPW